MSTITVRVPLTICRRGGRKMVVAPEGAASATRRAQVDSTVVNALARASGAKADGAAAIGLGEASGGDVMLGRTVGREARHDPGRLGCGGLAAGRIRRADGDGTGVWAVWAGTTATAGACRSVDSVTSGGGRRS